VPRHVAGSLAADRGALQVDARRPVRTGRTVPTVLYIQMLLLTVLAGISLLEGKAARNQEMLERSISTVEDRAG
jgi:hypothetical protein